MRSSVLVRRLREGLFTIPSVMLALSIGGARLTIWLDESSRSVDRAFLLSTTVAGGRSIAAAVAGATITVTAIVFSITALISQIAANNYSPRAVAGFLEDRFQQFVIGLVAGTFAYSVLVLAALGEGRPSESTPLKSASITVTVILGVASVVAIVAYIDHSLERMRIDRVVPRIASHTVRAIRRQDRGGGAPLEGRTLPEGKPVRITATRGGWVRSIDAVRLAESLPAGSTARVEVRVGEAISQGDLLVTVWPETRDDWTPPPALELALDTARDRSLSDDPAYGIRQLVDIGLRALSPGVNDPTTAVDVIHHLKLPLREILISEAPDRVFGGSSGQRVFLPEAPSISDHVHAAFSEIRLAGAGQPMVIHALIENMADLIDDLGHADLEARAAAVREEAEMVVEAARAAGLPEADLKRAIKSANRLSPDPDRPDGS